MRSLFSRAHHHTSSRVPALPAFPVDPAMRRDPLRVPTISEPTGSFGLTARRAAQQLLKDRARSVLVVSPERREGASTVAVNLATACALDNSRTLLLSADLRHPRAELLLSATGEPGLRQLLNHLNAGRHVDLSDWCHTSRVPGLSVIPAGAPLGSHIDELGAKIKDLYSLSKRWADITITDAPAVGDGEDAEFLARHADIVVLVWNTASPSTITAAVDRLHKAGATDVRLLRNQSGRGSAPANESVISRRQPAGR